MNTGDSDLDKILGEIESCDTSKRKIQSEITHFSSEVEKANKELEYFRKEMDDLDREYSRLLEAERRRRGEIAREKQNAR